MTTEHSLDVLPIVNEVLDSVSEHSRRSYERALMGNIGSDGQRTSHGLISWLIENGRSELSKSAVQDHIDFLRETGVTDSSIAHRLAAIRKLADKSADGGVIDESTAYSIKRIQNPKSHGKKLGRWLTKGEAKAMLDAPDADTLKGVRDRAAIAVLVGCGLRRDELVSLTIDHLQQRDGRWVIVDLLGKRGKIRHVPMADWCKVIVDSWINEAGIEDGYLFLPIRKGGALQDGPMSSQAVWNIVQEYSPVGKLAPHDLRRTFAKLAHKAGAPIEQIQLSLGHDSIAETEVYLGVELDLKNSPSDMIQLGL